MVTGRSSSAGCSPLLLGLIVALVSQRKGLRWNAVALGFSCVYLAWSAAAQMHVKAVVRETLAARGGVASTGL
jgi:inner membrane protein